MKIKTNELTGAALDWAVAMAENWAGADFEIRPYSTDWAQGGPIIEQERIRVRFEVECYWHFTTPTDTWIANYEGAGDWLGPTLLIAAMRCYVASKLGDTIDIPEELK